MCLGIPGRIVDVWGDHGLLNGNVDFGGAVKQVCLAYIPDPRPGEYVIVHVGFAITRVDEEEARRTLEILTEMGDLVGIELADDTTASNTTASNTTADNTTADNTTADGTTADGTTADSPRQG